MPSSRNRPIRLPPVDFAAHPLHQARQVARIWYRIHPTMHSAIYFSRVPTHRFSHRSCPYKLLYVGIDPETCLWERFGDTLFDGGHSLPQTQWDDSSISAIDVPAMQLCDLGSAKTRGALSVDLTALMNDDLGVPQAWGLAIQTHPDQSPAIKFKSRFTGRACLAIFERGRVPGLLKENALGPLNLFDPASRWLSNHQVSLA